MPSKNPLPPHLVAQYDQMVEPMQKMLDMMIDAHLKTKNESGGPTAVAIASLYLSAARPDQLLIFLSLAVDRLVDAELAHPGSVLRKDDRP